MKHIEFTPQNVCSKKITFDITDDNLITNLSFIGGCNGNLKAISKLLEGFPAEKAIEILQGNTCGMRNTSCADQLTKAIKSNL